LTDNRTATVFGAATVLPGEPAYEDALKLGSALAKLGWSVATGGYAGTMEAVSHGARQEGGHTFGVTCDQIEAWRGAVPNAWISEEIRCHTLRERLYELIHRGRVLMALPGGIGTLSEVTLSWSLIQTKEIDPRPLVLIGRGWREMFQTFLDSAGRYVSEADGSLLTFADDWQSAADWIAANHEPHA
jgi:uncharacterized protein (TIGR00730 family)